MIDFTQYIQPSDHGDCTPAFDKAVRIVMPTGGIVFMPAGQYRFKTKPQPIRGGVRIEGEGAADTSKNGTVVFIDYNDPDPDSAFWEWTGDNPQVAHGTGGGVEDLMILKEKFVGGCALKVKPTSPAARSGWWTASNVGVLSQGGGILDRCIFIDGSNIPVGEPSGIGVRDISLQNVLTSGARACTVELKHVVHLQWHGGLVQTGTRDIHTPAVLRINGVDTQDIHIYASVWGILDIQRAKDFVFSGRASQVVIGNGCINGRLTVVGPAILSNNAPPSANIKVF